MAENIRHIIKNQILDFHFPDKNQTWKDHSAISGLYYHSLLPVIEKVFNKNSKNGTTIKIDTLEIDLGNLNVSDLRDALPAILEKKLDEALKDAKDQSVEKKGINIIRESDPKTQQDILLYFLQTGLVPWYISDKNIFNLNHLIEGFYKTNPGRFHDFFVSLPAEDRIIKRMINHLNKPVQKILSEIYSKEISSERIKIINDIILIYSSLKKITSAPVKNELEFQLLFFGASPKFKKLNNEQFTEGIIHSIYPEENEKVNFLKSIILDSIETTDRNIIKEISLSKEKFNKIQNTKTDTFSLLQIVLLNTINITEQETSETISISKKDIYKNINKKSDIAALLQGALLKSVTAINQKDLHKEQITLLQNILFNSLITVNKEISGIFPLSQAELLKRKEQVFTDLVKLWIENNKIKSAGLKNYLTRETRKHINEILKLIHNTTDIKSLKEIDQLLKQKEKEYANNITDIKSAVEKIVKEFKKTHSELFEKEITKTEPEESEADKNDISRAETEVSNKLDQIKRETETEPFIKKDESEETNVYTVNDDIYIENAGLIILHPFLTQLFNQLELLENNVFVSGNHKTKAINILNYLVNEKQDILPEYYVTLNKILCGVEITRHLENGIPITSKDKKTATGLLEAVINHWAVLKNTSVNGLRGSFLQRTGRIKIKEDKFILTIEKKTIDMLLEKLPWGISMVKTPWMNKIMFVEW